MVKELLFTPTTDEYKARAEQVHAGANKSYDAGFGGKDAAPTPGGQATDNDDDAPEGTSTGGKAKTKSTFKWGDVVGGLLGVGGAWFLSSMFGGGWLGTIMFALFAIPAFMMGRSQLSGMISGLLGETPNTPTKVAATEVAQVQSVAVGADGKTTATGVAAQPTPQQALQQEVAEVAEKSQLARAAVAQMVRTGEINPRRGETALRNVARAEQMVQQMQGLDVNRLSDDQLKRIMREINQAENYLDRTIGQNPILAAQIQQSGVIVTHQGYSRPQGAYDLPQAGVTISHQGYSRPVFSGPPQNSIGAMTPEAQMQLQAVQNTGQNYQYQQAPSDQYAPPSFNAQPQASPYAVPFYTK